MTPREEAAQFVRAALDSYFGEIRPPASNPARGWSAKGREELIAGIVNNLCEFLRPVVEADLRGRMMPYGDVDEATTKAGHAAIADYCRHRRLALERAADTVKLSTSTWSAMLILLALDEAHYARLAERPLKRDEPIGQLG